MPEISDAQYREYVEYQTLGTPDEVRRKRSDLEKDNRNQREEIRVLKEAQPPEGSVLLTPEDGKTYAAYVALGKPSEITARLEAGQKAEKELTLAQSRSAAVSFAKAAGLADAAVDTLLAIPALEGATFEVRTQKQKNDKGVEEEVSTPYVTLAGEGQKAMKFTDLQEKVPATKGLQLADQKVHGTLFVQQGPQQEGPAPDKYERIRQEEAAKKESRKKEMERSSSVRERMGLPASTP